MPSALLSRRRFLAAAAGLASSLVLPRPAQARGSYRALRYTYDAGFNATEVGIVRAALDFVAQRMLDPRMFRYADAHYRHWYARVPGRTFRNTADFEAWFQNVQVRALLQSGFPQLSLFGRYDAGSNWTGRAPIGTVVTEYYIGRDRNLYPRVAGTFAVTLNTAMLGSDRFHLGRCPHYWAGVIAHEMLHNLGHEHPVGVYEGTFIRAYERAVWLNADGARSDRCGLESGCCG